MKKIKAFDEEEQFLMDSVEAGLSQKVSSDDESTIVQAIKSNKTKTISIRISDSDLNDLKAKANRAGLPYQTLINSIIHRYILGDIVLKENI